VKKLRIALLVLAGVSIACYAAIAVANEKYDIYFAALSFSRGFVLLPACAAIPACVALGFRRGRKCWQTVTRAVLTAALALVCFFVGYFYMLDGSLLVWKTESVLRSPSGANKAVIAVRHGSGHSWLMAAPLQRGGWYRGKEDTVVSYLQHPNWSAQWPDDNTLEVKVWYNTGYWTFDGDQYKPLDEIWRLTFD